MNKKIKRQFRLLTIAAATGAFIGLSGCATTGDFDNLQSQINAAAADAAAAKAEAAAASSKADQAFNTAMEANNTATEANKRSMDTEAKIDNMFKKAMHK